MVGGLLRTLPHRAHAVWSGRKHQHARFLAVGLVFVELAGQLGVGVVVVEQVREALKLVQDQQVRLQRPNTHARESTAQIRDQRGRLALVGVSVAVRTLALKAIR